jgi:uncharacterized NAD(P)/FAD-binding protein YdhS
VSLDAALLSEHVRPFRVGIVGGGFSGAAVAYHLARRAAGAIEIAIVERRPELGRGVAYSAVGEHLLLNVPAGRLSIDPEVPGDFYHWAIASGRAVQPGDYLPRGWFGSYVQDRLSQTVEDARGRVQLRRVNSTVVRIMNTGHGLVLAAANGTLIDVDHAVLALGNGPTRIPEPLKPYADNPRVLASPFDVQAMQHVAREAERVLLVGTGLTMCDAAISLAQLGYRGTMTAISPSGRLPEAHGPSDPAALAVWRDALVGGSLTALLREVKRAAREHGFRSAVDALRPKTPALWASLSLDDRRRFLKRLASVWDRARHRQPPEVAEAVEGLRAAGALRIARGVLGEVRDEGRWLACEIQPIGGVATDPVRADAVILCTGPEPDPCRWGSRLFSRLIAEGTVVRDELGIGLQTSPDGLVIGRDGVANPRLSAMGPLRRGMLWESTAVPELSQQAADLAEHIGSGVPERVLMHAGLSGVVEGMIRSKAV